MIYLKEINLSLLLKIRWTRVSASRTLVDSLKRLCADAQMPYQSNKSSTSTKTVTHTNISWRVHLISMVVSTWLMASISKRGRWTRIPITKTMLAKRMMRRIKILETNNRSFTIGSSNWPIKSASSKASFTIKSLEVVSTTTEWLKISK